MDEIEPGHKLPNGNIPGFRFGPPIEVGGPGALTRYDEARRAIAECKSFDDVRDWEDKAAALQEYGRRARDRTLELDACEIRERARRRAGEILRKLRAQGHLSDGRKKTVIDRGPFPVTLESLDVTKNESARYQKIAELGPRLFEERLARCRAHAEQDRQKHSFDVLHAPDAPVAGARSVMASRQEPDDSHDYFPTPPFATRSLIEIVLPHLGVAELREKILEPACGEGHIAEVLRESCASVIASDVFDYGYGDFVADFLTPTPPLTAPDWIITNPPFGDQAIKFVRRALELSRVGVAMFFRSQWAVEGIERYELIFRDRPPTLCAFFVERVNLCKGRWEPDGTTATAYCWLVWVHGMAPIPPLWIPPGQRAALTRPGDRERFTSHPVTKRGLPPSGASQCAIDGKLDIPDFLRRMESVIAEDCK